MIPQNEMASKFCCYYQILALKIDFSEKMLKLLFAVNCEKQIIRNDLFAATVNCNMLKEKIQKFVYPY